MVATVLSQILIRGGNYLEGLYQLEAIKNSRSATSCWLYSTAHEGNEDGIMPWLMADGFAEVIRHTLW